MEDIITQIPGFERGKVHRVTASDKAGEALLVASMASRLSAEWNTSVLCLSLDGSKEEIESALPTVGGYANIEVTDQKNPDIWVVRNKIAAAVGRRFVRAAIICGAERLRLKTDPEGAGKESAAIIERTLSGLAFGMGIPVILVDIH